MGLPPFQQLVRLTLTGAAEETLLRASQALLERLQGVADAARWEAIGPAPALPHGRRGWHLLLKGRRLEPMLSAVRRVLDRERRFEGVRVLVDVDPY